MLAALRFKLLFGPYRMPRFKIGGRLKCRYRGKVKVVAISDAPISWPATRGVLGCGPLSLILCGDLVRAVKHESSIAVCHHWRVTAQTVSKWRKVLGVGQYTSGTMRLKRDYAPEVFTDETRAKVIASTKRPERNAKIAEAMRGRKMLPHVKAALLKTHLDKKHSAETRQRMSETHKQRGSMVPGVKPWKPKEDALLGTLYDRTIAKLLRRSWSAVCTRRERLGIASYRLGLKRQ